jgi:hypothetical protein
MVLLIKYAYARRAAAAPRAPRRTAGWKKRPAAPAVGSAEEIGAPVGCPPGTSTKEVWVTTGRVLRVKWELAVGPVLAVELDRGKLQVVTVEVVVEMVEVVAEET